MPAVERELISILENRFERISTLLYDTTVSTTVLDEEVAPYLADDVVFVDPWQQGGGRSKYRLGLAGFHCMLHFDFDLFQAHAALDQSGRGRAIVDGVMNLKQLERIYTYPLRTILIYDFTLTDPKAASFLIHRHEEIWSFADMIDAVPGLGWAYRNLFRKAFGYGFLGASYLCTRMRGRRTARDQHLVH